MPLLIRLSMIESAHLSYANEPNQTPACLLQTLSRTPWDRIRASSISSLAFSRTVVCVDHYPGCSKKSYGIRGCNAIRNENSCQQRHAKPSFSQQANLQNPFLPLRPTNNSDRVLHTTGLRICASSRPMQQATWTLPSRNYSNLLRVCVKSHILPSTTR